MKRIAIVSNYGEVCGMAEYSKNMFEQLQEANYAVDVIRTCPLGDQHDVVFINYHPAVVSFTPDDVRRMQSHGAKVALMVQESHGQHHVAGPQDAMDIVDAVTAHEPMEITHYAGKKVPFHYVPHGLPEVEVKPYVAGDKPVFGTAGFAFPNKHMEVTIKAALATQGKALVIAPQHPAYDAHAMYQEWNSLGGSNLTLETRFLAQQQVVKMLAGCTATIYFAIEPEAPGQSGSSRMMAAARRPLILRHCPKTRTLLQYEDELYFVNSEDEVMQSAAQIWKDVKADREVKVPYRMLKDLSWKATGKMYVDLVEELWHKKAKGA